MMWKPIDSAPKDGTRIIVWCDAWNAPSSGCWYGSWWGVVYELGAFVHQPTHWQPMPDPPSESD
ncbi:MAG: DUF551 domain-containing protein [Alphaproteobacteria bacterium GM202ARS2]|nr:DUF551 domain-containing protein [Alphaproteobacteria bacterium GM202ARS2]